MLVNTAAVARVRRNVFDEFAALRRMWHGSLAPGRELPPYEDVTLGSLGRRLADHLILLDGSEVFTVLRAGRGIQHWLGEDVRDSDRSNAPFVAAPGST